MKQGDVKMLIEFVDLISEIETALSKARYVQQDVCEDFFGKYSPYENAEDRTLVAYGFNRYRVLSLIVEDSLADIEEEIGKVKEMLKVIGD